MRAGPRTPSFPISDNAAKIEGFLYAAHLVLRQGDETDDLPQFRRHACTVLIEAANGVLADLQEKASELEGQQ